MEFAHPTNLAEGEYYRRLDGFNDALTGYQAKKKEVGEGGVLQRSTGILQEWETMLQGMQRHALLCE